MESIYSETKNRYRLDIYQDTDYENPRKDWDHDTNLHCFHRSYQLGDKHKWDNPTELREYLEKTEAYFLPVYLYDHSGLAMKTTPFSCLWDSGQVGYIWMSKETARQIFQAKRLTKKIHDKVYKLLWGEVQEYHEYLAGEVYYYAITDTVNNETIDCCGGFFGYNWAKDEAVRALNSVADRQLNPAL